MWYHVKVLRIRYNLFAGTDTLSLSVYEPIEIQIVFGDRPPICGEGVEIGGGVWYSVKAHIIGRERDFSIETDTLSRFL